MRVFAHRKCVAAWSATILLVSGLAILPARPAKADPGCVNGGIYVLFVRGSSANIGSAEAKRFKDSMFARAWPIPTAWAEIGNLDGSVGDGRAPDSVYEYPAVGGVGWVTYQQYDGRWQYPGYAKSVTIGTNELVKHLNHRYTAAPVGRGCYNETVIIGGYSQGADVVGWAIERSGGNYAWSLSADVRNHIGAVALYGDPKYQGGFGQHGNCYQPPWVALNEPCGVWPRSGVFGARQPYAPSDIWGRVSSYCVDNDVVCGGNWADAPNGVHESAYKDVMITASAQRITSIALGKRNQLNPGSPPAAGAQNPPSGSPPPLPPVAAPLPPPDTDGDGTTDPNDACPHVYVAANNGCPAKGDFSLDGKSDVPSFYRYEGQSVNLWMWNGQSNLYTSGPYAPWGTETGWEGQRLIPAGTADYNGDKMYDTAAFYAYDGGAMGINVMYGNNQADLNPFGAWYAPSGWEQSRVIPAGAGDFNKDGRGDVAAFYRYNNQTSLYVWYGQENMHLSGPHSVWWAPDWEGARVIPVGAGDTDGDGNIDISTFYRHEGGMVDHNVWYGNGGGGFTLGRPWHVASGWDGSRLIPGGVTDLNGDGRAETIAFFRHDNNVVDMRSWWGTANRVMTGQPGSPWSGSGWDGSRIIPAGTGDYNGDGKADMASFYRYDGQEVGLTIWYGTGTGLLNPFTGWHTGTAWEGARLIPPTKG